jgi:cytochrome c oxidase subunit 4
MSAPQHEHAHAAEHESHDHVLPPMIYYKVYGALLVLTFLTVMVSYIGLGELSIPAALAIAVVKAGLVIGFFMHLKYDVRFNSLVFFSSILFLSIFFAFTFFDLSQRGQTIPEMDTFSLEQYRANAAEAAAAANPTPEVAPTPAEPTPPPADGPSH